MFFDFTGYESQLNAATAITVSANARWSTNLIRDISFFVIDDSLEDKVNTTLTYAQATSDGIWSGGTMLAERTETEAVSSITLNMNTDEVKNAISSGDNSRLLLRIERISSTGGNTELNVASLKCTVTYSADCVSQLAEEMQWSDVSGQSIESVTRNITLPAQYKNCDISWHSDNEAVVGSDGTVIRQSEDATVTLTATLRLGSKTASRSFTITVPKGEPVAEKELYTCAISCSSAYSLINDGRTFSGLQASNDRKSFAIFDFTGYETQLGVAEKITLSAKSLYSTDRIKDIRFVVIDDAMEDKINSSLTYLYAKSDGMWDGGVTVAERTDTSDLATLTIDVNTEKLTNAFSGSGNSLLALRIERASAASGNTIMDPTALTMTITYSSDCVSQLAEGMQWSDVSNQSIDDVTSKLTLPSLYKICGVTWQSSDDSVISSDGTVNQKTSERTVTLTATLILGKKSAERTFSVTVPRLDPSVVVDAINSTESWLRIKEIIAVENSDFFESTLNSSEYRKLKDADPVFKAVAEKLPYANFDELSEALDKSVARAYKDENASVSNSRPSGGSRGSSGGAAVITTPAQVNKTTNTSPAISFNDVSDGHWAYAAVSELSVMGTISGYEDNSLRPQANITRAEF
ncbi:MAG: S-layer homology domain-containing protein, partial [Oscillospiraceae bacterium]|nr:S-layer homology domain-containing protein [Oscillospiraceae bacterium]